MTDDQEYIRNKCPACKVKASKIESQSLYLNKEFDIDEVKTWICPNDNCRVDVFKEEPEL